MPPKHPSTRLIHHPYQPPAGFEAVQPGVHKASTVLFANVEALRQRDWRHKAAYTYGLHGTPTTFTLEARLASLEGGANTLLTPSGLSALALVNLALLKSGDEVLIPDNAYAPLKDMATQLLAHWGIGHRIYQPMDLASGPACLGPRTRLLWLEAPGSVTLEFPDLPGWVLWARQHGITTALDNTWGSGLAFSPFALGIDLSVQALTKYPSGGADVLMGSVTSVSPDLHEQLTLTHMRLGLGVGANDAEAVLRGLPSLALRYRAQDESTRAVAQWWTRQSGVAQVLHPALPDSPGHRHWKALCTQAAGLCSVRLDSSWSDAQVDCFLNHLQCFRLGYSWAGPMSLVVPYRLEALRQPEAPVASGTLLRFALGLEHIDDLLHDLEQALQAARGAP